MSARAEFRRQAKQKTATYNMTAESLQETIAEAAKRERDRILREVIHGMNVAMAFVAHDQLGLGKVRLERFIRDIIKVYDSMENGYVSLADMERTLFEETGVRIK